ncbi:DUF7594 domain-containing protein [Leifsonia kafniensis]|uniref:CBM96 family carbohydrate-binding protein n=1 Tax=Leifsonia kafniensis TaxID=475957 RepID=UPI0031E54F40
MQSASALSAGVSFSADDLPTWQTDGVVYSSASVHGKVIVGGTFAQIRQPEGSAGAVQNQGTLAIFNAETGEPDSCQLTVSLGGDTPTIRSVIASPDGNTIYLGGNFASIGGVNVPRLAAIDPVACVVKPLRTAGITSFVYGLAATATTLYLAGEFLTVDGQTRNHFAAVDATTGALLPWAPSADTIGRAIAVSPDQTKVAIGGDFLTVNGQNSHAIAVVDATTGANLRNYPLGFIVRTSVTKTLLTDGNTLYGGNEGSGGGVFDGRFAIDWTTLDQKWRDTCLGATQAVLAYQGTLYSASHAHDCNTNNAFGDGKRNYFNAQSTQDGSLLGWHPTANDGIGEGIGPRSLTIATGATTGKTYLWSGGEFTIINGKAQQGLTRFGPDDVGKPPLPAPIAEAMPNGTNQVRFRSVVDPDDNVLTYRVYRNGASGPIWTGTATSLWWSRPQVTFVDENVTVGSTYSYRVTASDGVNTTSLSPAVSVTAVNATTGYQSQVIADGAQLYWRLDDTAANWAQDRSRQTTSGKSGQYLNGVTLGQPGAITGDPDTSALFNGSDGYVWNDQQKSGPTSYTIETWIKTNTNRGGKIVGYGDGRPRTDTLATQLSSNVDKQIYMDNTGRLTFGVNSGGTQTIRSGSAYNNNAWHHIVATQGANGMALYVDGVNVGQNTVATNSSAVGNWHVGGDNLSGWPNRPTSNFFAGQIDETAIYSAPLSAQQVARHYTLAGGQVTTPTAPTDAYGARVFTDDAALFWRLDETSGTTAKDSSFAASSTGTYGSSVVKQQPRAIQVGAAVQTNGSTTGLIATKTAVASPREFSVETWFKTATTSGGKIAGFESSATGTGSSADKQIYMTNSGALVFGVNSGGYQTIQTAASFNNNAWHHVVGTQGADGLKLYVDGVAVGTNPTTTNQSITGYWRAGGGNLTNWPSKPSSNFFTGTLDEFAAYTRALPAATVLLHYQLGTNTAPDAIAPSIPAGLSGTVAAGTVSLSWAASSDNVAVTGYEVHRGSDPDFVTDASNRIATPTAATYSDVGAPAGAIFYRVNSVDAAGNVSRASVATSVTVADSTAPSVPGGLTASVSGSTVSLSWTAATDDIGVTGYSVYRGLTPTFTADATTKITAAAGTSATDSVFTAGDYYYKVAAFDAVGNTSAATAAVLTTVAPTSLVKTVNPTGDAMVFKALPTTNYGSDTQLSSRGPDSNSPIESYLSFALPTAEPGTVLAGATLRLRTSTDAAAASADAHTLKLLAGAWTEEAVTWNNRPTGLGAALGTLSGASALNTNYQVVLDASQLAGLSGTTVSFALQSSAGSDNVRLWSNNSTTASYRPLLTLSYEPADIVAPSVPGTGTAVVSASSVSLSWPASTDNVAVTGYSVHRGSTAGFVADASNKVGDSAGTTFVDTAVAPGTYFYRVSARDAASNVSAASDAISASVQETTPPSQPIGLTAAVTGDTVSLSWTASTDNVGVTGYSVHRGSTAGFEADASNKIADSTGTTSVDVQVAAGTSYYRVIARDAASNVSPASEAVSATIIDTVAPSAPNALTATVSAGTVSLGWAASTDNLAVTGYSVHRSATAGFVADGSNKIADSAATSYLDSTLAAGTYYYRVVALDAAGNSSAASAEVVATIASSSAVLTVNPSEDAMVYRAQATTNYGADTQLSSRGDGGGSPIESYLKFALPAAPAGTVLTGASLQMRTSTDPTATSVDIQTIKLVTGAWTEAGVIWNNRPTGPGADLGTLSGLAATNTNYLSALNATQLAGLTGTTVSFAIVSTGVDNARFWSINSPTTSYRPLLTLTYTPQ